MARGHRRLNTATYDFHGVFSLALHTDSERVRRHFQAEYGVFEAPLTGAPDLDVTAAPFAWQPHTPPTAFGKFRLADGWIYGRENYKVSRWHFALHGLQEPTTRLLFHGDALSLDFLQHFYVEQIMRQRILHHGLMMVHGGCVARNGASVLFPALGQTGKTTLSLRQTLAGWRFQADDYTFLTSTGETWAYPRRLHLSDHVYADCPAVMRWLSPRHALSIKAKKLVYHLTLRYGDLSESLRLREILPQAEIEPRARLNVLLLLTSASGDRLLGPRALTTADAVRRIMAINGLEGRPFDAIRLAADFAAPPAEPTSHIERERAVLTRALSDVPAFEVVVPRDAPSRPEVVDGLAAIMDALPTWSAPAAPQSPPLAFATAG